MKKEKKLVEVKATGKEKVALNKEGKIVDAKEVLAIPKEGAKPRRIFAVILWILAIACEAVGILNIFKKITLPDCLSQLTWLIILIVADLIFLVIGSMLWKKANHIDPASEKNKTKFWLWNNLGSIVAVIAFLPLIIVIFTSKDLDGRTKKIAGIVAVVALLIGGIASYDFNPVSSEQLEAARAEILANGNYDTNDKGEPIVYWLEHSTKYHINKECQHINRKGTSDEIKYGTIDAAFQNGLTEPCRTCIKAIEKTDADAAKKVVEDAEEKTGD